MWTLTSYRAIALSLLLAAVGCSAPSNSSSTSSSTVSSDMTSAVGTPSQAIIIDGSITVYPISDEVAKEYQVVEYTTLPEEAYAIAHQHFQERKVGTVFDGQSRTGLTIEELLKEEAAF
ncbi:MAG: hypothetical protein WBA57_13455 [Elainellaceae cyanobacterium]